MVKILVSFLRWYFVEKPLYIVRAGKELLSFLVDFFALPYLLRTFFWPWANLSVRTGNIVERISSDLVFRFVGMGVRALLFLLGSLVVVVSFLFTIIYLLIFWLLPFSPLILLL